MSEGRPSWFEIDVSHSWLTRLRAGLPIATAVILAALSIYTYVRVESAVKERLVAELSAQRSFKQQQIERWLASEVDLVERAAAGVAANLQPTNRSLIEPVTPRQAPALYRSLEAAFGPHAYFIAEQNGRILAASSPELLGQRAPVPVSQLLGRVGGTILRAPSLGPRRTPKVALSAPRLYAAARISDKPLLLVSQPLATALERLIKSGPNGVRTTLVDAHGRALAASERAPRARADRSFAIEALRRRERGNNVDGYLDSKSNVVIGAWTWLPSYELGLIVEQDRRAAHTPLRLLRAAFWLLIAVILVSGVGFWLLTRGTRKLERRASEAARELNRLGRVIALLKVALEGNPAAVLLVNLATDIVYANAAAHDILKHPEPLAGQSLLTVLALADPELQEALEEGSDSMIVQHGKDQAEALHVSARELDVEGSPHALYVIRRVTQELNRQEVESWKKLIRVLSHELNNSLAPITSLLHSARKIAGQPDKEETLVKIFDTISDRAEHLRSFLESYRQMARLPKPTRRYVEWKPFVENLKSLYPFELSGSLPKRSGYFDPVQLEQVLLNLFKNAAEAGSPPEEIKLVVDDDDEGFEIQVLDRGPGMEDVVLSQAILPFYSTKRTGTGIGLALSREIVEAHRGRFRVANRENGGLVVSCWLPHARATLLTLGSRSTNVVPEVRRPSGA